VVKRTHGGGPAKGRQPQETKPVTPSERHSGEGSASALETLQKLEKRRFPTPADHNRADEDPPK
jgi:hypothetical protein